MKKTLFILVLFPLAACDQMEGQIDGRSFLDNVARTEGPKVPTIQSTLMENARSAEKQGEWKSAGQIYQQLLEKEPENLDLMVAFAETQRRTGEYDRAVALYDLVLSKKVDHLGAMEGKGLALLSKGDFESPVPIFEAVMKADPKRWKTLNALGILFATRNMHEEALSYFKKALDHSPANTSIMNNMGLAQALNGQTNEAIDTLLQAGTLASGNEMNRKRIDLNLALVYAIAGKLDYARQIAEHYYSGPPLNNNMGLYAHLANDNKMAKAYLNTALTQSNVFYTKAWENLQAVSEDGVASKKPKPAPKSVKVPAPQIEADEKPVPAPSLPAKEAKAEAESEAKAETKTEPVEAPISEIIGATP